MALTVALQMDPIESIHIDADSSFVLGLEAQRRGHDLWHYRPSDLIWREDRAVARMRRLALRRRPGDHFTLGEAVWRELSGFDVVLMRQDPPFDLAYLSATYLLERLHPRPLVVNHPTEVRNAPEKLFVLDFPEFTVPTLIASDPEAIADFRARHGEVVLKPLYGNGGFGVVRLSPEDENLGALLELFGRIGREPIVVQKYLPEVRRGDKRIVLIDGRPVGAVNRVPRPGEARSNMHIGGRPEQAGFDQRDLAICEAIGPELKRRGLIFVGIDVIGGCLTEINVTSPTGLQEIDRFDGVCLEAEIWDAIEAKL